MSGFSEPGPEGQCSLAAWAAGRLLHICPIAFSQKSRIGPNSVKHMKTDDVTIGKG